MIKPIRESKPSKWTYELIKEKSFLILPNGYDPELVENVKSIKQQNDCLSIAFVGSIYDWQPLRSFLSVMSKFIKSNKEIKIRINFYGIVKANKECKRKQ